MINNHEQKHRDLEKYIMQRGLLAARPINKQVGDLFFASDFGKGAWLNWDGANWVTDTKEINLIPRQAQPYPAGTADFDVQIPNYNLGGWKLDGIFISFLPGTAQSGTVFYNVAAFSNTTAGGFISHALTGTKDTKLATSTIAWYPFSPTVSTTLPNTHFDLDVRFSIGNGSPGSFIAKVSCSYRLIAA